MKRLIFAGMIMILAMAGTARGEWEFQESGVIVDLNDIYFIDELHGWTVGDSSTIIRTANDDKTGEK